MTQTMDLAINIASIADGTLTGALRYLKDLEIDRLVIPFGNVPGFAEKAYVDVDALKAMKREIEEAGLSFHTMQYWPPLTPKVYSDSPEGKAQWEGLLKSLEAMSEVGADTLNVFMMGDYPEDPAKLDEAWDRLVTFYRKFIDKAEACGVRAALHPVAEHETRKGHALVHDFDTFNKLVEAVPSPSNAICICIGNLWLSAGDDIYDQIRKLGDRIALVHVRATRRGHGEKEFFLDDPLAPDFAQIMKALRDITYQGDLTPEHLPRLEWQNKEDIATAWTIGYVKAMMQLI
ncbi:MAG TPA: sugar phosphate isomerase/epimerase [Chloroflexi bacterium]|nr:sugar phosphate isomerase/epimerase [Chloroflexota bacterium]